MGTITSGTGLISGLNISDIVSKLMAIERQPVTDLQTRVKDTETQRTAFADLSARVLAMKATLAPLQSDSFFQASKATSSNPDVLQISTTSKAAVGTYSLRVQQMATAQQLVSRGIADPSRTPLGSGTIVVAAAQAKLSQATSLDFLNNQRGVSKGTIRITDGSGASAQIDLSAAKTVDDVLAAINNASGVHVRADVQGDHLALTDLTGMQTSALTVADVAGGSTAQDLGIAGTSTSGQITGTDVNTVDDSTLLSLLNDGKGIGINGLRGDFQIAAASGKTFTVDLSDTLKGTTNLATLNGGRGVRSGVIRVTHSDGKTTEVDLTNAKTIGDVLTSLGSVGLTASATGTQLRISDTVKGAGKLTIEDVSGHAAADLGITGSTAGGDAKTVQTITGQEVHQVRTLGDAIRAINYSDGNAGAVTASLASDGKSLVLTDNTIGTGPLAVTALAGSTAAADLGLLQTSTNGTITGQRLIATMNSTLLRSLNGGQGIRQLGQVRITDRAGNQSTFDLSGAQSLEDILSTLRTQTGDSQVQVQLNDSGLGLVVNDASGGTGTLKIEDLTGTTAQDLKIAGQATGSSLRGGALYRQYVSGNTLLKDMNGGKGIAAGSIRITDSAGHTGQINVAADSTARLQEVLDKFNDTNDKLQIEARINDSGDGIVIVDKAGGSGQLTVEDNGSTTASDLRIAGTAEKGQDRLDGRASVEMNLDGTQSLNDLVDQLNGLGNLVQASVINDGSGVAPYRLILSAANTGTRGALAIDTGGSNLDFSTLVQAQDAIVYYGGNGATGGVPIVSSGNQLDNVIKGATLTLTGQSDTPITATIATDTDAITQQISSFVDKYNDVMSHVQDLTKYDADTGQSGVLLGDATVERLRDSLYQMMNLSVGTGAQKRTLADLGLSVGTNSQLSFDQNQFNQAFASNADGVRTLFTTPKTGLFAKLDDILTGLTDSSTGLLPGQDKALQQREDLFNQRISDMNVVLDAKQNQLNAQFQAMESALAQLQTQQASLSSLSSFAASMKSSSSSSSSSS